MVKSGRLGALALGIGVACGPAFALEGYVLYDDFSSTVLDGNRWSNTEHTRTVEANAMRLVQREWGPTTSDAGSQSISWGESVTRPGPITQFRANVRVTAIDMTGCAPNPTPTQARARIVGTFFNSGNRVPGSMVGDVLAQINVQRSSNSADAPGVLQVQGGLFMCDSPACDVGGTVIGGVNLGTTVVGANTLVQIEWDRANRRFLFSRDQGAPTALAYTVDDSASPGNDLKDVQTRMVVASCASAPRAFGFIDAKFDNVSVNLGAKP